MRPHVPSPGRRTAGAELRLPRCRADYAAISFTDAQIGRVIDALEATGPSIADNTITCLWSDHGWHLGDTNSYTKLTNFETVRPQRSVPALRLREFDCVLSQSPDDSVLPQSLRLEADNHTFDGHRAPAIR